MPHNDKGRAPASAPQVENQSTKNSSPAYTANGAALQAARKPVAAWTANPWARLVAWWPRSGKPAVPVKAPGLFAFDERPEPPEPPELPFELRRAHVAMLRILHAHPDLGFGGFGTGDGTRLLEADALDMFVRSANWWWGQQRGNITGRRQYSYWLKHQAAHEIGYTSSGPFIAAAIVEGFRIKRDERTPNCWIGVRVRR